jgi:Rieske Fe-S protein
MDRRAFVAASLACLAGCSSVPWYVVASTSASGPIRVPAAAIGEEGFVVLGGLEGPILLTLREDGASAVELVCTHRACTVRVRRDRLVCPCHGSEFTTEGAVVRGPAQEPLRRFPVTVSKEGDLIVERG